jgi:hypothetical protein
MHILWTVSSLCVLFVRASVHHFPLPPPSTNDATVAVGASTFEQLIDHDHPEFGTFPQRYWWNAKWWQGEGSPVS